MDLSVIIVCFKGYERLNRCLESIASFSHGYFSMEVFVVNNNPGDAVLPETERRFPGFRFIHNKVNGGYSNGCNLGCSSASGKFYLILNPDTVVSEEAVLKLLNAAVSNPQYKIISCRQLGNKGKDTRPYGKYPWSRNKPRVEGRIILPDWVSGSLMLISSEVFRRLGGFDEDFFLYYEDVDICRRVRNEGGEIALFDDIEIEHFHGASSRAGMKTTAAAKCEVQISRHLYIHKHEKGFRRTCIQIIIAGDNLLTGLLTGIVGLLFFFTPSLFIRFLIFCKLTRYYANALSSGTWMSPRSVNYRK